ncbi:MAG: LruC domain-containing protein, partial [Bacteroidota bacterium]
MKRHKLPSISSGIVLLLTVCSSVLILTSGCRKVQSPGGDSTPKSIDQLVVSPNFNWATTRNVDISLSAKDNMDSPVEGVRFTIYTANPDSGGVYITSGITGADGVLKAIAALPTAMNKVTVYNNFVGLVRQMDVPVTSGGIVALFGGKPPLPVAFKSSTPAGFKGPNGIRWAYMSSYDSQGVPGNLMPNNDPVPQQLLHDLNTALPEYRNELAYHPEYFAPSVPNNLEILAASDVFITYISEGAGWMNSLGFFTFNTNQPPTTAAQIDTIHLVFPNVSNNGSGGGLYPGNKVRLGHFAAGKSIGFALVPHGWGGSGTNVGASGDVWYSIPSFNTTDPQMLKHLLFFNDPSRQQILFTYEDQGKYQGADMDSNDGIFYLTINPTQAVSTANMPLMATTVIDTDHDGVPDNSDDYPSDPNKAFNNYTPSKSGYSSLAFEDLWPSRGDYDFNDLVISYRFNQVTNPQNQVVEIDATIITEAIGASYHSGFGFQLPVSPDKIQDVTGISLNHGYITTSANHTEAGQSKAVIIAFDDAFDHLRATGQGQTGANTTPGVQYSTPDTLKLVITLSSPVSPAFLGTAPYNSFIIVGG